jgi:hypothetical protein
VTGATYEEPGDATRADLESALASGDERETARALVGLVFHDDDCQWCQGKCLELLDHPSPAIRRIAVTCLGHIARIHRRLDVVTVMPALQRMRSDADLAGVVDDAVSDIETFVANE